MKKSNLLLGASMILSITACSVPKPGSPEAFLLEQKIKREAKIEEVKDIIDEVPDWFISSPKDNISLYASGTAVSGDLQTASDLAIMNAKGALSDSLKSTFSSKVKQMIYETGDITDENGVSIDIVKAMENLVPEADLGGYEKDKYKIVAQGAKYRAFVLLKYPMGEANRILAERLKKEKTLYDKIKASKEYDELRKAVKEYKEENKSNVAE